MTTHFHRCSTLAAGILAVLLVAANLLGETGPVNTSPADAKVTGLTPDEKLLLVLNRFTHGPRPGDLEEARNLGLQKWFARQLSPEQIEDNAVEHRLARYPAMQLPLPQLMLTYPNQQTTRKAMNGRADRPSGEIVNAIYKDSIARYNDKLKSKTVDSSTNSNAANEVDPPLPQDLDSLLAMPADRRFKELCKFTPQQLTELRRSAQPGERLKLAEGFSAQQLEALAAFESPAGLVGAEAIQTKLLRDIYSERQLNEVMVDFGLIISMFT